MPKPTEDIDARLEAEEVAATLLADLPALRPAHKFRIGQRVAFENLMLNAVKDGIISDDDDGPMEFDIANPADIERLQKLRDFVVTIDEWAEGIAVDKDAYAEWAEGKTEEHFMALFQKYQAELGESGSSVS
ncbi:hypothetical protein [Microbacterium sp. No. 7]|uniref:hypothetical protein n=1 Tax=Microbacterium sp. No. 7 TaxID=1714373 RepID=UPI0006D138B4|nr:hypothetical protein [Microbacterium sp. No. 7]ALJ22041.1 hypothetical protein AOA12_19955 [Microbacterium sp. No. 7]